MTFGVDSVNGKGEATNSSTIGWTHTTGAGANKLLVGAGCGDATIGDRNVSGITFNGVALSKIVERDDASFVNCELWYLDSPAIGAFTTTVTFGGANSQRGAGSVSFIDAATGAGASASNTGTSANPSITSISAGGSDIVVGSLMTDSQSGNTEPADGTYTEISDQEDLQSDTDFHAMYKTAATTMAWASSGSGSGWVAVAAVVAPATGAATRGMPFGNLGNAFGGGRIFNGIIR